jgi:hypothetical protein
MAVMGPPSGIPWRDRLGGGFPPSIRRPGDKLKMALNQRHPPGPPMTFGNMREQGVQPLIAYCPPRRVSASGAD